MKYYYVDPLAVGNDDGGGDGVAGDPTDEDNWTDAFDSLKDAEALDIDITADDHYTIFSRNGPDAWGATQLAWSSWTTDATHTILVKAYKTHRHTLTRNTGYYITCADSFRISLQVQISYIYFNGIAINATDGNSIGGIRLESANAGCYNCVVYDCTGFGILLLEAVDGLTLINCAAYSCTTRGFVGGDNGVNQHYIANCTAINCADGFYCWDAAGARYLYCHNCYSGGNSGDDYAEEGGNSALENNYCMSEDETADDFDGANNTTGVACETASGAYFANIGAGTEDVNINNDSSSLIDAGDDLDGNAWWPAECETGGDGLDYTDVTRSATWDVGADERIVAAGAPGAMTLNTGYWGQTV